MKVRNDIQRSANTHQSRRPNPDDPCHNRASLDRCFLDERVLLKKQIFGENNSHSKLTEGDVIEILSSSLSHVELAKIYGVSSQNIGAIRNRKTWTHVKIEPKVVQSHVRKEPKVIFEKRKIEKFQKIIGELGDILDEFYLSCKNNRYMKKAHSDLLDYVERKYQTILDRRRK